MWPYVVRLFTDEGAFVGWFRAVIGVLGIAIQSGELPLPDTPTFKVLGVLLTGSALFMRSSASAQVPVLTDRIAEMKAAGEDVKGLK